MHLQFCADSKSAQCWRGPASAALQWIFAWQLGWNQSISVVLRKQCLKGEFCKKGINRGFFFCRRTSCWWTWSSLLLFTRLLCSASVLSLLLRFFIPPADVGLASSCEHCPPFVCTFV